MSIIQSLKCKLGSHDWSGWKFLPGTSNDSQCHKCRECANCHKKEDIYESHTWGTWKSLSDEYSEERSCEKCQLKDVRPSQLAYNLTSVLESANLCVHDENLLKKITQSLDTLTSRGDMGIRVLVEYLNSHLRFSGSQVNVSKGGEHAWNEWLKNKEIISALARAKAVTALPLLLSLMNGESTDSQYYDLFQPSTAAALGEFGDIKILRQCLRMKKLSNSARLKVCEAIEKITGSPVMDAEAIIAKCSKMDKGKEGDKVLTLLAQIDQDDFAALDHEKQYFYWYLHGWVYKLRGDKATAIKHYEKALTYYGSSDAMAHERIKELKSTP